MRRFEIIEIANGWLICYHTECGFVAHFEFKEDGSLDKVGIYE